LYVKVIVQLPQRITASQTELLKKYMELEKPKPDPQLLPLTSLGR